jgi:hypothetical protein
MCESAFRVHPRTCHKCPEGKQMYSSTLSLTSALKGVGGQRHAPPASSKGKTRYPSYRRLGGLKGRSGRVRKISPPTGFRSPDRPARNESLYRLSYPGPLPPLTTTTTTTTRRSYKASLRIVESQQAVTLSYTGTWYRHQVAVLFTTARNKARAQSPLEKDGLTERGNKGRSACYYPTAVGIKHGPCGH